LLPVALAFAVTVSAAACSDDDEGGGETSAGGGTVTTVAVEQGGELVDGAQLSTRDNLTSFDPGLVQTLDESQVTTALYDGLTDFDYTDKANPVLKPDVAESFEGNEDATEFTFTIKEGETFSNGDPVLPSSFKYAWERNGAAEFASPYGYLINFVEGGAALQEGTATTLDSVVADDEAMTLTVTLSAPNADFPSIVSHPFFGPLPQNEVEKTADDPAAWGEIMIGNGPFKLESMSDQEVVIVRNDSWSGNIYGDTRANLDKITFKISADPESAYTDFEAGNLDTASIPSGQYADAMSKYGNTVASPTLGTYYFDLGATDPQLSGPENLKLRQAISLAIDRDEINAKVYESSRRTSTGITPTGIPGAEEGLCEYCTYDQAKAQQLFDEWKAEGGTLDGPITIDFNTGGGHEDVVAIIQENLKAIGIESTTNPVSEKYFGTMADGGCHFCRAGWYADYPTYGNFMYDLFSTDSIGGNNLGSFSDPQFDELVAQAQAETDDAKRGELYRQAESYLLNDVTATVPINWYNGDQVYAENVVNFDQPPLGIILWERVGVTQ
jgi:ABC-type oligopeptide transport system substrate-binding subunit